MSTDLPVRTHLGLDHALCGRPEALGEGEARVRLDTTPVMAADDRGLVHGGFVFGAADHAAMLAVNDPLVVLGAADTRFLAPVRVGESVVIDARRVQIDRRKHVVEVRAMVGEREVLTGTFTCFVTARHVLDDK